MLGDKERADVQESLLLLYLRLNGYFVSSFIVHSPNWGKNITQIDALAVRHEFNREPYRVVRPSCFLKPKGTDLLVCEVKSRGQPLQFNPSFRENDAAIRTVLGWAGLFDQDETGPIASNLRPLLQPSTPASVAENGVVGPRESRIRGLLCSPERRSCRQNQPWFLSEYEIFSHIASCLNPEAKRPTCSTQYDINLWGSSLSSHVRYFKSLRPGDRGSLSGLYGYLRE